MVFAKERAEVIAAQLKKLMVVQKFELADWKVKEGFFLRPEEADECQEEWKPFDSHKDHWYGPDRHIWFRSIFTVPESFQGKSLWLSIRTQIEEWDDAKNPQFLVFIDGQVIQGADMNHREVKLTDHARAGQQVTVDLQAYSGTLHPEFNLLADICEISEAVRGLYYDMWMPLCALGRLDAEGKTSINILTALNDTINCLDLRDTYSEAFYRSVEDARACIGKELYEDLAGYEDVKAACVGHTHIDVAWWWTVEQTREKAARSFATVLKLMEEYPEYRFMSSQPVLYQFVKERYPEIYEKIKARVAEGRWEPEGGMWLEADCNLTSGESLARQFLYGKRFFREEFGVDNRVLWLPDVFGYSGALPQIMKKCGIDYFMTTKLSWNQFNKIPDDTLLWEGIDGTKVLTHFISTLGVGQSVKRFFTTYNGLLHPDAIMGGWQRYQNKEMNDDILIAYGYGDGGGGPTREMLETGRRMEKGVKEIPKVRQERVLTYFTDLEKRVKDSPRLHTWTGEFYFEYHRGTYTSMARNKRSNRKSELLLMDLELLSVLAAEKGVDYPAGELERLWKMVLLNQFHDILPGSSIKEVYEVTKKEYEQIAREGAALLDERKRAVAGEGDGITVWNTTGALHSGLVPLPDGVEGLACAKSVEAGPASAESTEAGPASAGSIEADLASAGSAEAGPASAGSTEVPASAGSIEADLASAGSIEADLASAGRAAAALAAGDVYAHLHPLPVQEIDGTRYAYVRDIPSKGFQTFIALPAGEKTETESPFQIRQTGDGYEVETPHCKAVIGKDGTLTSLFDKKNEREVFKSGQKGNLMRVYEDKPIYYDNWDIDVFYSEKSWDLDEEAALTWTSEGPLCAQLCVERQFMHSKMIQKIRFYAHTPRIDFDTWVDWREHQYLLKALFPFDVHTDEATFDIQFGNVVRKTHTNTSWEQARFESCAHKWMDVSEGGYGVSLLNDCKYGHSVREGVAGLTLIKSGIEPNPDTDNEEHRFTYSVYPHKGTWKEADTQKEAADLNQHLTAVRGGQPGTKLCFACVDKENVVLETVKRAEDGDGVILRLYESRNMRSRARVKLCQYVASVTECDLLENPAGPDAGCEVHKDTFCFTAMPYEIKTFRVKFS